MAFKDSEWKYKYHQIIYALDDRWMDKRTDEEAHEQALKQIEKQRKQLDAAHRKLVELGVLRGLLEVPIA